ncbi:neuropeptide CCHamide-2 receptor-like [Octopus sinensis]|uniref:Neuropeptide CCHamide-2 receptor-like n=1 Tax=Octopus sinensis TaxID=2607531 RepID=A0A6P7T9U4_9MOLL|nr:neuropeptide CCHamide-2 receptor-like [Octopus sinensis]
MDVMMVWKVFPLVYVVIGTLGNLFVMIIFLRNKDLRRSPNTIIMFFTSLIDIVLLYVSLLWKWYSYSDYPNEKKVGAVLCKFRQWIAVSFGMMEPWFLIVVTFQRTWLIYRPLSSLGQTKSQRRSILQVVGFMIFILLLNSHLLYDSDKGNQMNIKRFICCDLNSPYLPIYIEWLKIQAVSTFILPTFLILILDVSLLYRLGFFCCASSAKYRRGNNNPNSVAASATRNLTLIFAINIVYLVTSIPTAIFSISGSQDLDFNIVCNILLYIRNTFGFLTYLTNSLFRKTVSSMFSKRFSVCCRRNSNNTITPENGTI